MTETIQEGDKPAAGPENGDGLSAAERELVLRYLSNQVTDGERAMIETRIVTDPAFRKEIELTEVMRQGLQHLASRGELAPLLVPEALLWTRPSLAFAASIAAIAFAVTSVLLYTRLDQVKEQLQAVATIAPTVARETLRFELTRSASGAPDITWRLSTVPTQLELQFDVGLDPAASYTTIIDQIAPNAARNLLVLPNLGTDADGQVVIGIHSALLQRGDYRVRLEPTVARAGTTEAIVYSMRITD